jgi:hypothetical protein
MSNINISDLNSASEIRDLSDRELDLQGGSIWSAIKDAPKWAIKHIGIEIGGGGGIISVKGTHDLP